MQQVTDGSMLNFGYWNNKITDPLSAQENLCSFFGKLAELECARKVVDIGSGFSAPAIFWQKQYSQLNLSCVNINFQQLRFAEYQKNIDFVNSTATMLPFSDKSFDRVLALESAQHFKRLGKFIDEARRVLSDSGILALAIPITMDKPSFAKLGLLQVTWSSEHHSYQYVKDSLLQNGFEILYEKLIGENVYQPLADYYLNNRESIKSSILKKYPQYVESVLFKSIKKMKTESEKKVIDYIVLKCRKSKKS